MVLPLVEGRPHRLAGDRVPGWEGRRLDLGEGRRWPWAARAGWLAKGVPRIGRTGMSVRDQGYCGVRDN